MTNLQAHFNAAAECFRRHSWLVPHRLRLALYGLYKQATSGDVSELSRPSYTDLAGNQRYAAWHSLRGVPPELAMRDYINLVNRIPH